MNELKKPQCKLLFEIREDAKWKTCTTRQYECCELPPLMLVGSDARGKILNASAAR